MSASAMDFHPSRHPRILCYILRLFHLKYQALTKIPTGAAMKKNSSCDRRYATVGLLVCGIPPLMEIMVGITLQKSKSRVVYSVSLMATARVATTIHENTKASYSSGDPCGRHAKSDKALHSSTQMCYSAFNLPLMFYSEIHTFFVSH
jgi:hypothetical protein